MPLLQIANKQLAAQAEAWVSSLHGERRLSSRTQIIYTEALESFLSFLNMHLAGQPTLSALADLKTADVRAYLSHLRQTRDLSSTTLAQQISALRSFFKFLERAGHVSNPAIQNIRTPKRPHAIPRPVSEQGAEAMIEETGLLPQAAWVRARDAAIITLLYGCGLRISEALSLKKGDIPDSDALRIVGKGNKERIVPVLPVVHEAIENYLDLCPHP